MTIFKIVMIRLIKGVDLMNNMIKTINSINNYSKKIIFFASVGLVIACSISVCLIIYNATFYNQVELHNIATTLIKKSSTIYTQFIIGAILMDCISKNMNDD